MIISNQYCCQPTVVCLTPSCGVSVTLESSDYCTRVCETMSFTVTVTNNSCCNINCCNVDLNITRALCVNPETIQVDGVAVENANPNAVSLGTLTPNQSVVITYQATVMECQRYVRSRVYCTFSACCCLEPKCYRVQSNVDMFQVCCCCNGTNNSIN